MSKSFKIDLTGQRFGRLTVLEFVPNDKNRAYWKCKCDCGNEVTVNGSNLSCGNTISCGCLHKEKFCNLKHGKCNSRLYQIWKNMKTRCYNKRDKRYKDYGGRGISMCVEWKKDFMSFYNWAMLKLL